MPQADVFNEVTVVHTDAQGSMKEFTGLSIHFKRFLFAGKQKIASLADISQILPLTETELILNFNGGARCSVQCPDSDLNHQVQENIQRHLDMLQQKAAKGRSSSPMRGGLVFAPRTSESAPLRRARYSNEDDSMLAEFSVGSSMPKNVSRNQDVQTSLVSPTPAAKKDQPPNSVVDTGATTSPQADLGHMTPPPLGSDLDEVARKKARIDQSVITTGDARTPEKFSYSGKQYPRRERPMPRSGMLTLSRKPSFVAPQSSSAYRSYRSSLTFGLQNLGNTCYLNAVMQALCSLREFVSDLQDMPSSIPLVGQGRLFQGSSEILQRMSVADAASGPLNPAKLREMIADANPMFRGNQQQDAHEFLLEYVNQLHDELLGAQKAYVGEQVDNDIDSFGLATQMHFDSEVHKRLECINCKQTRDVYERFRDFSLDFPTASAGSTSLGNDTCEIREMLREYFQPELLEAKCEHCGYHAANMDKQLTVAPQVLVLHLKRFVPNIQLQRYDKQHQNVTIPLKFDLKDYLKQNYAADHFPSTARSVLPARPLASEVNQAVHSWEFHNGQDWQPMPVQESRQLEAAYAGSRQTCEIEAASNTYTVDLEKWEQRNNLSNTCRPIRREMKPQEALVDPGSGSVYDLRAIVSHDGASPHSGHYVCYARGSNGSWRLYDDSMVKEYSATDEPHRNLGRKAYILFYVLQSAA
jgi:ubiquitin C-terminal hydrolase